MGSFPVAKILLLSCMLPRRSYDGRMIRNILICLLYQGIVLFGLTRGTLLAAEEAGMAAVAVEEKERLRELDAYWKVVSRAVNEGDFEAYRATCHPEGVLVSGNKRMSQPLTAALARWKQEFVDTKEGKMRASVAFRFSRRLGDATTAHETGIFRYESQRTGAAAVVEYVRFEALLVKRGNGWQILMENQQESASEEAWRALE